jgi:hypothetical protein
MKAESLSCDDRLIGRTTGKKSTERVHRRMAQICLFGLGALVACSGTPQEPGVCFPVPVGAEVLLERVDMPNQGTRLQGEPPGFVSNQGTRLQGEPSGISHPQGTSLQGEPGLWTMQGTRLQGESSEYANPQGTRLQGGPSGFVDNQGPSLQGEPPGFVNMQGSRLQDDPPGWINNQGTSLQGQRRGVEGQGPSLQGETNIMQQQGTQLQGNQRYGEEGQGPSLQGEMNGMEHQGTQLQGNQRRGMEGQGPSLQGETDFMQQQGTQLQGNQGRGEEVQGPSLQGETNLMQQQGTQLQGNQRRGEEEQGPSLQGETNIMQVQGTQLQGNQRYGSQSQGPSLQGETNLMQQQGTQLQGHQRRGMESQGVSKQGIPLQSALVQGARQPRAYRGLGDLNGAHLAIDGDASNAVTLQDGQLVARGFPDTASLKGTTIAATAPDGRQFRVLISAVTLDGRTQRVEILVDNAPPCEPEMHGMFVAGRWDAQASHVEDSGVVTYSCMNGVIAKCVDWGYAPWLTDAEMHASCTRMARADYCGKGTPWTMDGTSINMYDLLGIQTVAPGSGMEFEAAWGPQGAICVSRPRYEIEDTSGRRVLPACFATLPRCKSLDDAVPLGAMLANRSKVTPIEACE